MPKPIRWFSIGENFRYEKPQKGRLRSFYQLNADLLGEASATADAELIALCADCLLGFGLTQKDFSIRISDRQLWFKFLESEKVPTDKITSVLGVVDKLERSSPGDLLEAMKVVLTGTDCDSSKLLASVKAFAAIRSLTELEAVAQKDPAIVARLAEWKQLLDSIKALGFSECVSIDLTIVRGLAYYTGFVFEAFEVGAEARALAGGGRYDTLVKKLGGPDLPAAGFGMGDITVRDLLESKNLLPKYSDGPNFYVMILGDDARVAALEDIAALRRAGFRVEYNLRDGKFPKLIQSAETIGAQYALVYGGEEVAKGITKVRSLIDRTEATIPRTDIIPALRAVLEEGMRAILS
jgi:histidyl-tRNA synthetase